MKIGGAYGGATYQVLAEQNQSMKELSTGKRINSAADDAAGASQTQRFEAQTKEFAVKVRNLQSQSAFYQVGDTGLQSISDSLIQMKSLAVSYQNDTLSDSDKRILEKNAEEILKQIDGIASQTEYNTQKTIAEYGVAGLGLEAFSMKDPDVFDKISKAAETVSSKRGDFGSQINGINSQVSRLQVAYENTMAAGSRIEDADMLLSIMKNTTNKIKEEAGVAVSIQQTKISQDRLMSILKND